MKKYLLNFLSLCFLLSSTLVFESCTKKGDDDPWISFRTRNQRLTGDWILSSLTSFDQLERSTSVTFNQLIPCDTAGIEGINSTLVTSQQSASSASGYGEIQSEVGSVGSVATFTIHSFSYDLKIDKNGTYQVQGSYAYAKEAEGENISGTFAALNNAWHWVDGDKQKDGITFINYPVLDVGAASEAEGRPISYLPTVTFEMTRLSKDDLKISMQTREDNETEIVSDTYFVPSSIDSLAQCISTTKVKEIMRYRLGLNFRKKTENDTL